MEKKIIDFLCKGLTQLEISNSFKKDNIKPNSLSIIEKTLKKIRKQHNAKTNFELAYIIGKNERESKN